MIETLNLMMLITNRNRCRIETEYLYFIGIKNKFTKTKPVLMYLVRCGLLKKLLLDL